MEIIVILWYLISTVQSFLAFGTAYRLTKNGGDNGVSLWGWLLVLGFASWIPGLGVFLWFRYKDI